MAVTIKDIAKRVGLSVTTVSRALNDFDDVRTETKDLIRRTANEMGYVPNTLAQRFQKRKTDTIGLILPTFGPRFSDPFFSELLAGIGNKAASQGYDLLVSTCPPGEEELLAYRHMVQGYRVDGLVVVRTRKQDERIEYLRSVKFPFVAFGRTEGELDFPFVDEDGIAGMRLVADHIVNLGHKRVACISSPPELMFTQFRFDGLQSRLREHNAPLDPALIRIGTLTQQSGYEKALELINLPTPPTAIIAFNDLMAFGAMSAAQNSGLVVGRDISIVGFDNTPMASHSHPPLTTVDQPIYQIGSTVCEMLGHLIQGEPLKEEYILLSPELIARKSSGTPSIQ